MPATRSTANQSRSSYVSILPVAEPSAPTVTLPVVVVSAGKSWPAASDTGVRVTVSSPDSELKMVPVASLFPSRAPDGSVSSSRNVSPLSSTVSSMIGTATVFTVSPGAKVSVPDVAV